MSKTAKGGDGFFGGGRYSKGGSAGRSPGLGWFGGTRGSKGPSQGWGQGAARKGPGGSKGRGGSSGRSNPKR